MTGKRGSWLAAGVAAASCAWGAVEGRYVRIDALTHAMENAEVEVFSAGDRTSLEALV